MRVVGGTYREICREYLPHGRNRVLAGSGLRAAAVLRQVDPAVSLATAIDDSHAEEGAILAKELGLEVAWSRRDEPVIFSYHTPISSPEILGLDSRAEPIEVRDDAILVFGMLEAHPRVQAESVVYDPQKPRDLGLLQSLEGIEANRVAIVANEAETLAMSGESSYEDGAKSLLRRLEAEVVVTKLAARGACVTTSESQVVIAPWPTETVWPIGSGDVFAAGFAWAWGQQNYDPVEAARVGSYAASRWCSTNSFDLTQSDFSPPNNPFNPRPGQVYLAGPFFDIAQRWLVELVCANIKALGGRVFSPYHDIGLGEDEVAAKDLVGLEDSSAVLALLDTNDAGTVFEAGWASRSDIPVIVYSENSMRADLKMLRGSGAITCTDISSSIYRAVWASMGG